MSRRLTRFLLGLSFFVLVGLMAWSWYRHLNP